MLILTRGPKESIRIGEDVLVTIVSVAGGQVKLAFDAPPAVTILREELLKRGREKPKTSSE